MLKQQELDGDRGASGDKGGRTSQVAPEKNSGGASRNSMNRDKLARRYKLLTKKLAQHSRARRKRGANRGSCAGTRDRFLPIVLSIKAAVDGSNLEIQQDLSGLVERVGQLNHLAAYSDPNQNEMDL